MSHAQRQTQGVPLAHTAFVKIPVGISGGTCSTVHHEPCSHASLTDERLRPKSFFSLQRLQQLFVKPIKDLDPKTDEPDERKLNYRRSEPAVSLLTYSLSSMSIIIVNKLVMTTHGLNHPIALLFLQNLFAVALVCGGKWSKRISYPDMEWRIVMRWLPLTGLFVAMLYTSMVSLHLMSVASQALLKNISTVLTAFGDWYFFNKVLTREIMASFAMIMLGSCLSVSGDQWVTPAGLVWTGLNIVFTSCYLLYMKCLLGGVSKEIGHYGTVFYNNVLSLPFLFFPGLTSFPLLWHRLVESASASYPHNHQRGDSVNSAVAVGLGSAPGYDPYLVPLFLLLVALGGLIPFAIFWAMGQNSPTTVAVTGTLGKIPLTLLGVFIFQMWPSLRGWWGIVVGLTGGIFYTYFNITAVKDTQQTQSATVATASQHRKHNDDADPEQIEEKYGTRRI